MTEDTQPMPGREIADLLPFYAMGTLGADDRSRVAAALAADPALQRELALVDEERAATIVANESLGAPSRVARDRFAALLEAEPPRARRFDPVGWIAARLEAMRPRTLAYAGGALALVLLAEAGIIGTRMMSPSAGSGFETASVATAPTPVAGALVILSFAPEAKAKDIDKLLADNAASIVAGPLPGGLYQVRIGDHPLSSGDTAKIIGKLKAQAGLVRFAAPGEASPD